MLREKVLGNPADMEDPVVSVSTIALEGRGFTEARVAEEVPAIGFLAEGYSTLVTAGLSRLPETAGWGAGAPAPRGSYGTILGGPPCFSP